MTTITIPKEFITKKDLIAVPYKEYEKFLKEKKDFLKEYQHPK
ncbi:MAG: hypothetical protein V1768_02825 [Patescibacteria group bacterium]